jgi:hypothetical protein
MPSDRELDAIADAIDEARAAARAERDSRPFDGNSSQDVSGQDDDG